MDLGGRVVGTGIIIATLLIVVFALAYTHTLAVQRESVINQLEQLPQLDKCDYENSALCPQAEEAVVIPNKTGFWMALLAILLGCYLIRSDHTHRSVLQELRKRNSSTSTKEEREIVYSVLTKDEQSVVEQVRRQPGISQATLRLRTDMSKAKLSQLLKELEGRKLLRRTVKGKTNAVELRRRL